MDGVARKTPYVRVWDYYQNHQKEILLNSWRRTGEVLIVMLYDFWLEWTPVNQLI